MVIIWLMMVVSFNPSEKYESQMGKHCSQHMEMTTCSKPPTSYGILLDEYPAAVADQDDAPTYSAIEQVYKCIVPAILGGIQCRPFHPKKWRNVNSIFIIYTYVYIYIYVKHIIVYYIYCILYSFKQLIQLIHSFRSRCHPLAFHQTPKPQHQCTPCLVGIHASWTVRLLS